MTADAPESRFFLRKLRVKNYKCLEDIEISFGDLTLLLGKNGAGKTAVFEVLDKLRRFVLHNSKTLDLFPPYCLTRWSKTTKQKFTLEISDADGRTGYRYYVIIEIERGSSKLVREYLHKFSKKPNNPQIVVFDYVPDMYRDTSHVGGAALKNRDAAAFQEWIQNIVMFSPMPFLMQNAPGQSGVRDLDANGGNYPSWHLDLMQTEPEWANSVLDRMQEVLPGFSKLRKNKNTNKLSAVFERNGKEEEYLFSELSSGQCVLIALYTLVFGDKHRLLLLDEPDNFVMLPEIQPLLMEMESNAGEELPQIALISHHPEAIDLISPQESVWLDRGDKGSSVVKEFNNDTRLHTSELYARGMAP